jgi:hypothetical protein
MLEELYNLVVKKLFAKGEQRKLLDAIDMVKMGVLERLERRYLHLYEREIADFLAAAVVNDLFCEKPSEPQVRQFLQTNWQVVERELTNLKYDEQACRVITQAMRFWTSLSPRQGDGRTESFDKHIEKLTKLGIFLPGELKPTVKIFLKMANEFYQDKQ